MSHSEATARTFEYRTVVAAATHVINHNLGSRFVSYTAYVTATGQQIVQPSEIDQVIATNENTLTIELSASLAITVRIVA